MSVVSLKGRISHNTDARILDLDHAWFQSHPDRFCRVRRALPDEFAGAEYVAVMRHPGLGRMRAPIELSAASDEHCLDDRALESMSDIKVKQLFASLGVRVSALERAWRRERELATRRVGR